MKKLVIACSLALLVTATAFCMVNRSAEKSVTTNDLTLTTNLISLSWNGSSWDIVSQYPVASDIFVTCDGPETFGIDWRFAQGTSIVNTGVTDPGFGIAVVFDDYDDTYQYIW